MPITLSRGATPPADDAVGMLTDCHGRIRRFLGLAGRLAEARPEDPAGEVAEAARDVHRYFTISLPLHEADEEQSITTRLRAHRAAPDAAVRTLEALPAEHRAIEQMLAELLPEWLGIGLNPEMAQRRKPVLATATPRLAELFTAHLEREERDLFPALRSVLSADELAAIRAEMRARRQ